MTQLGNRFKNLSQRERVVLLFGGIASIFILLYSLVWEPWQDELTRLRTQVPVKRETLAWMEQQTRNLGPLIKKANAGNQSNQAPLLTLIEQSARQSKMNPYIRRMAPGEGEQVKIWMTEADFDKWLIWLEVLRKQGVEVESATVNRAKDNKVTIRMTLQR
ncbi:type II secretion system protein GspM [Pseudomonadota bacterium]